MEALRPSAPPAARASQPGFNPAAASGQLPMVGGASRDESGASVASSEDDVDEGLSRRIASESLEKEGAAVRDGRVLPSASAPQSPLPADSGTIAGDAAAAGPARGSGAAGSQRGADPPAEPEIGADRGPGTTHAPAPRQPRAACSAAALQRRPLWSP